MCPSYLDGDQAGLANELGPVIPKFGFCAVFKVRGGAECPAVADSRTLSRPAGRRSLKTQQHAAHSPRRAGRPDPVDIGEPAGRSLGWPDGRACSWRFPRKEVIQPQLPLRLPCYDFTPVTSPTFDGSLPKGLGHRLRVLPASVV